MILDDGKDGLAASTLVRDSLLASMSGIADEITTVRGFSCCGLIPGSG